MMLFMIFLAGHWAKCSLFMVPSSVPRFPVLVARLEGCFMSLHRHSCVLASNWMELV